jgi:NAD(P)-dependent dehydrogenase (short-subunit alcohol dehydrogenase family)
MIQISLEGQVAIVTGGSTGIGKAIVSTLAEAGAEVVIVDRDKEKGEPLAAQHRNNGREMAFLEMDLYNTSNFNQVVNFTNEQFGRIDLLVNCAGIYPSKPAFSVTEEEWNRVLDLNLKAPFFLAQEAARYMMNNHIKGSIINIASTAATMARPGVAHYCSSKAGLVMLTRVLALEWAQYGIRVNSVCPGLVETEALMATLTTPELQKEHEEKISKAPLMRAADPDEIARGVLYFADSKSAGFITGQSLYIDGGYTAGQTFSAFKDIVIANSTNSGLLK